VPVKIIVDSHIAGWVDIYAISWPMDVSPGISPGGATGNADTECNEACRSVNGISRRAVIKGGIGGIPPGTINNSGIIGWNIDYFRIRRFDDNGVVSNIHDLFARCVEISLRLRFGPKLLNGGHH
jgi:hypothetical protein